MTGCPFMHEEEFYIEKSNEPFSEGGFVIHTEIAPFSHSKARATIKKIVKSYNEYDELKRKEKILNKLLRTMKSMPLKMRVTVK